MSSVKPVSPKVSGKLVAAVDAVGSRVSVVVARAAGPSGAVHVVEARKFSAGDKTGVGALCERLKVASVVRVAPADACTARAASVPSGDAAGMLAAASLLAEGELLSDVPAHRRAGGLLPGHREARPGVRAVLLTAWVRGEGGARLTEKAEERWTTPPAALAALRGTAALAYTARPEQNAVCVLVTGEAATVARVVVEDGEDTAAWNAAVSQVVHDSGTAAGALGLDVSAGEVIHIAGGLDDLRGRVQGARVDEAWLTEYGIALGAAMVALDAPSGIAPLASMHAVAPRERVPAPVRIASWISRPAVAWTIGTAAALVLVAGPWALARQRAEISTGKAGQLEEAKSKTKDLGLRAAAYEQLEVARWPMTKVLADIAGAAPVGVTIEDARVSVEQGVTLRGVAKSRELVNELERNLGATKVFRSIKQNRNESKAGGGAEFDLSAQVDTSQVHMPVKPVEDFAAKNLAARLHGDGASNTAMPVGAKRAAPAGSRGSGRASSGSDTVDTSRRGASAPSAEAPPALTDAEINAMDRSTAMKGWSTRRSFLQRNSGIDPTVKQRLEDEVTKLKDRMQKAGEGGEKK